MEQFVVLAIMVGAVGLFVTERLPIDLVALLVLGALLAFNILTPAEGLVGFASEATITVACMFVLSAGLQNTGAVAVIGRWLILWGRNRFILLLLVMLLVALISAFINNTAAVAVLLPLVMAASKARKVESSRLLIPLSYASQFGGVCTLIGTSTNLLVSSISERAGYAPIGMFELAALGVPLFIVGTIYLMIVGPWLLPERRSAELTEEYKLGEYITELRVMKSSNVLGKTLTESKLGERQDVKVLELIRKDRKLWSPRFEPLQEGDILLVQGVIDNIMLLRTATKLELAPEFKLRDENLEGDDVLLVETLISPRSRFEGETIAGLDFHWHYNAVVLAIQRRGQLVRDKLSEIRLRFGDSLLLLVKREELSSLRKNDNIIVLSEVGEGSAKRRRALTALAIMGGVVTLAAIGWFPIVVTALFGVAAMIMTRCLDTDHAYKSVDWKVIILLAGILPLGLAMEKVGVASDVADFALRMLGDTDPFLALAAIYLLTAILTEFMSNNAAAVLLAPIAISTAVAMGVDPRPFLIAVTVAASTSFATPVGYQTNTMVYSAGGYKFSDFLKVGVPLNIIFFGISMYYIPKIWAF